MESSQTFPFHGTRANVSSTSRLTSRLPIPTSRLSRPPQQSITERYKSSPEERSDSPVMSGGSFTHTLPRVRPFRFAPQGSQSSNSSDSTLKSPASHQSSSNLTLKGVDNPVESPEDAALRKKLRTSLSDRTIQSLAELTVSSPLIDGKRRRSEFFYPTDTPKNPGRSNITVSSSGRLKTRSNAHRTTGSNSYNPPLTTRSKPYLISPHSNRSDTGFGATIKVQRAVSYSRVDCKPKTQGHRLSELSGLTTPLTLRSQRPTSSMAQTVLSRKSGGVATPRAALGNIFLNSSVRQKLNVTGAGNGTAAGTGTLMRLSMSPEIENELTQEKITATSPVSGLTGPKSSKALRDQIRSAKAAHLSTIKSCKSVSLTMGKPIELNCQEAVVPTSGDISLHPNPFNQLHRLGPSLIKNRVENARRDGRLNISAMGLQTVPEEVLKMFDFEFNRDSSVPWNEVCSLVRLNAADNDLSAIPESMFPDVSGFNERDMKIGAFDDYEPAKDALPSEFISLESIDLHGNLIRRMPIGLRHLKQLTCLNLSRNRLDVEAFQSIFLITSLRELNLSGNDLNGPLPRGVCNLKNLEILELNNNAITELPDRGSLSLLKLRKLELANNKLTRLPWYDIRDCPLRTLNISNNSFTGTLISHEDAAHLKASNLIQFVEYLDMSCNQLISIIDVPENNINSASLSAQKLIYLDISLNHLRSLPSISQMFPSLQTILATENQIDTLPPDFSSLPALSVADFSSNSLRVLDPRIGLMDSLRRFGIHANPLRERRYVSMELDDLKRELRSRIAPPLTSVATTSTPQHQHQPYP